jgi:rhodanese-related sulfurtransferase
LISAGVVLLILVAVLALAPPVSAPTPTQPAAVAQEDIPRATLSEAKAAYDAGSALFVDVRDAESYAASHIAGAASFPLIQLDQNLGQLDKTKWIITYCT